MGPTCRRPLARGFTPRGGAHTAREQKAIWTGLRVGGWLSRTAPTGMWVPDGWTEQGRQEGRDPGTKRVLASAARDPRTLRGGHSAQDEQRRRRQVRLGWRRRGGEDAVGLPQVNQGPARRRQAQLRRRLPRSAHSPPALRSVPSPLQSYPVQSNVANPTAGGTAMLV